MADDRSNIDAELLPALAKLKAVLGEDACFDLNDLTTARAITASMAAAGRVAAPIRPNVSVAKRLITDAALKVEVEVQVYSNSSITEPTPAILYFHGGGYVMGAADQAHAKLSQWCDDLGVSVITVEYRLAPEQPFPGALFDGFAVLKWLWESYQSINVDQQRIAIVGESAGGGLAAGLSLYARDHSDIKAAFQCLIYPMLDHMNIAPNKAICSDGILWSQANNKLAWQAYLGNGFTKSSSLKSAFFNNNLIENSLQYAAPFSADDLHNLPPTYIAVGDQDLFYLENKTFAERLKLAGNANQFEVYAGAFHGFPEVNPLAEVSKRFNKDLLSALRKGLQL